MAANLCCTCLYCPSVISYLLFVLFGKILWCFLWGLGYFVSVTDHYLERFVCWQIVDNLLFLIDSRQVTFTLPDEAFGNNDEILITRGSVKSGAIDIQCLDYFRVEEVVDL